MLWWWWWKDCGGCIIVAITVPIAIQRRIKVMFGGFLPFSLQIVRRRRSCRCRRQAIVAAAAVPTRRSNLGGPFQSFQLFLILSFLFLEFGNQYLTLLVLRYRGGRKGSCGCCCVRWKWMRVVEETRRRSRKDGRRSRRSHACCSSSRLIGSGLITVE